ncbi:MAG: hypothetical protein OEV33_01550 [Armatimonadota bacterium]|nr:hypothetical protein [Armatimonadota bacterium]
MSCLNSTYEQEAESFLTELEEEYYRNGAGLKETLDLSQIYEKYDHLFSRENVERLLESRETRPGRHLAYFAASQRLDNSVRALTQQITTAETQATLEWDGERVPYRLARVLLNTEPDRARRLELHRRLLAITEQRNSLRAERLARLHGQAASLGFAGYIPFCQDLAEIRIELLAAQMNRLLESTAARWHEQLAAVLDQAGIPREDADISDLNYLLMGPQFDLHFPKDKLIPCLRQTLSGLGIDLDSQANLRLDTEERPLKSPRAFCSTVRVPSDVRLVIMPQGGQDDYNTLFHEAGHAQHFVHTRASAPFAFRCLGDNSVTEGYAFLFNLLLQTPDWASHTTIIRWPAAYAHFSNFRQLYYLRRYAAKLNYERELHAHEAPIPDLGERYAELLGEAIGVRIPPGRYLADVDDGFYCARYLRGWMFEVQLRRRLVERFGKRWFASRDAGDFLKDLWELGQEFTADELAQRLDYPGLDPDSLIADLLSPPAA